MQTGKSASKRLLDVKEQIITSWEKKVRESAAPTKHMDRLELRNSLPNFLDVLIQSLSELNNDKAIKTNEKKLAMNHGKTRALDKNYSLELVINEYHILRQVIFDIMEEGGAQLTREERDLIWDLLFISIKDAAAEFKLVRDEQRDNFQTKLNQTNIDLKGELGEKSTAGIQKDYLLKTIFERVEDYAIFTLDSLGKISSWAAGAQKMKQYTSEEVIGKDYSMLYPHEGRIRNEPKNHLNTARVEGRFRGEGLRQRKDGELFLADVFITPMYNGDLLVGYFKIVTDILAEIVIGFRRQLCYSSQHDPGLFNSS